MDGYDPGSGSVPIAPLAAIGFVEAVVNSSSFCPKRHKGAAPMQAYLSCGVAAC